MARMIPAELPTNVSSPAERLLFRELNTQLGSDYLILHSVRWVTHDKGRQHDGEADFLIAHPEQGVLVLEVKGGTIRREGGDRNRWYSRDGRDEEHEIKNPFLQAERSMYTLRDKLASTPATSGFTYPMARTVAMPDVIVPDEWLGVDINRDTIIDSKNVYLLAKAIQKAMSGSTGPGPGQAGVNALLELIYPSFAIEREGLAARFKHGEAEIIRLTEQQLGLIDALGNHRRIAVQGIAGSGKTILAVEHARRLAETGLDVLFTCYNKALAAEVRANLAAYPTVSVHTYHELAESFVRRAGMPLPVADSANLSPYFEHALPNAFADAIGVLDTRFDAVVVDEGQDFADLWWVTLEALLRDPDCGFLAVFYDNNQGIFRSSFEYPIPEPHFLLSKNCRCTRQIHEFAAPFVGLTSAMRSSDRNGPEVEVIAVQEDALTTTLRKVVHRLTYDEGVPLDQIVVLTPRSRAKSALHSDARIGNLTVDWETSGPGRLTCRTIHAYKGLETSVIILIEANRGHLDTRSRLVHVALTRAKHHAVVIGDLPPVT